VRHDHSVETGVDTEAAEDRPHVVPDRVVRHAEFVGHLLGGAAACKEMEDLRLTWRERDLAIRGAWRRCLLVDRRETEYACDASVSAEGDTADLGSHERTVASAQGNVVLGRCGVEG
jgi:hypothetical protein